MHLFIFRKPATVCMNDQGLTNLYGSKLFRIQVLFLGPSITKVCSFNGLEWISYFRILISYLANIYHHKLMFSIILYRFQSYLIFSLLSVNLLLLS